MRILMVDWSGRKAHADRAIALAEVRDGTLTRVEKGRDRRQVVDEVLRVAAEGPVFAGFDFAFSLPAWFLAQRGWSVDDLWAQDTEGWLSECAPPFWGRPGKRKPDGGVDHHFRWTDQQVSVGGIRPKSVFQVGGAGSVGSGSLRGFPHLARLRAAGAAIWPFDNAGAFTVAEVYPRAFTGAVTKSSPDARAAYLASYCRGVRSERLDGVMAADEDCFDAGVTAMELWEWRTRLPALRASTDPRVLLEAEILTPAHLRLEVSG